jgi:hypothetical protein
MLDPIFYARRCAGAYTRTPDYVFGPVVRMNDETLADGAPLLVFPGTRPKRVRDDLADLDVGPLDIGNRQLLHAGFARCAQLALPTAARIALASGRPIDLTGHSLGAAIAIDLATLLVIAGIKVRRVVVFGCPHTALGSWQAELLATAGIEVALYRHGDDPVPMVPYHADLCPGIDRVLQVVLPCVGDWRWGGAVRQIVQPRGIPNIDDHDMTAGYLAALTAEKVPA